MLKKHSNGLINSYFKILWCFRNDCNNNQLAEIVAEKMTLDGYKLWRNLMVVFKETKTTFEINLKHNAMKCSPDTVKYSYLHIY